MKGLFVHRLLSSCFLILLATTALAQPSADPLPPKLFSSDSYATHPIWVRADVAATDDGEIDYSLFSEADGFILQRGLQLQTEQNEASSCTVFEERYESIPNRPNFSSLGRIKNNAHTALRGTVTGRSFGFGFGVPGQALEVEIDENIGHNLGRAYIYLFLPVGEFAVGKHTICKVDSRYIAPPLVGDSVVIFLDSSVKPTDDFPLITEPNAILVLEKSGRVRYPRGLTDDLPVPLHRGELLNTLRHSIPPQSRPEVNR